MTGSLRLMLWHWGRHGGGPRYTLELARALARLPEVEPHLSISRQCEIADDFRALGLPTFWAAHAFRRWHGACAALSVITGSRS